MDSETLRIHPLLALYSVGITFESLMRDICENKHLADIEAIAEAEDEKRAAKKLASSNILKSLAGEPLNDR